MASCGEEECDESILLEEIETLEAIYIHELTVSKNGGRPSSVSLCLHPSTAENVEEQYVRLTLHIDLPAKYPNALPTISIRNPRGLAEEYVSSLWTTLHEMAAERQGGCMLYDLIEHTQESLTQGNVPHGQCVICLQAFQEGEALTRTNCYHHFHCHCLLRYIEHCQEEREEREKDVQPHQQKEDEEVGCPVCRVPMTFDLDQLRQAPPPAGEEEKYQPSKEILALQKKMAALFQKQKKQGGIIDLEAEKNKFLIPAGLVLPLPTQPKPDGQDGLAQNDINKLSEHSPRDRRGQSPRLSNGPKYPRNAAHSKDPQSDRIQHDKSDKVKPAHHRKEYKKNYHRERQTRTHGHRHGTDHKKEEQEPQARAAARSRPLTLEKERGCFDKQSFSNREEDRREDALSLKSKATEEGAKSSRTVREERWTRESSPRENKGCDKNKSDYKGAEQQARGPLAEKPSDVLPETKDLKKSEICDGELKAERTGGSAKGEYSNQSRFHNDRQRVEGEKHRPNRHWGHRSDRRENQEFYSRKQGHQHKTGKSEREEATCSERRTQRSERYTVSREKGSLLEGENYSNADGLQTVSSARDGDKPQRSRRQRRQKDSYRTDVDADDVKTVEEDGEKRSQGRRQWQNRQHRYRHDGDDYRKERQKYSSEKQHADSHGSDTSRQGAQQRDYQNQTTRDSKTMGQRSSDLCDKDGSKVHANETKSSGKSKPVAPPPGFTDKIPPPGFKVKLPPPPPGFANSS